jgi:hypothetical protein
MNSHDTSRLRRIAALGLHNLLFDEFTPASCRYNGTIIQRKANEIWTSILTVTPEACELLFTRAIKDFERLAGKKASTKASLS